MIKRYKIEEGKVRKVPRSELIRKGINLDYEPDAEACYMCGRQTILYCNDCGEPVCNRCIYPTMVCGDCQE